MIIIYDYDTDVNALTTGSLNVILELYIYKFAFGC